MVNAVKLVEMPALFSKEEVIALHQQLTDWLHQEIEGSVQFQRLIFDFAKTQGLDSSAIVYLRRFCQWAKARGVEILGWSVAPKVAKLFRQTGLGQYLILSEGTDQVTSVAETLEMLVHPSVRSPLKGSMDIAGALVGLGITALLFMALSC